MKAKILAILTLSAIILTGCGASDKNSEKAETEKTTTAETAEHDHDHEHEHEHEEAAEENIDLGFVLPKDAVSPDLSKEDPSDDNITFLYDDLGRISSYTYFVGDKKMMVGYVYDEESDKVWIIGYVDQQVAVEAQYGLIGTFDPSIGFVERYGYFFNGYEL